MPNSVSNIAKKIFLDFAQYTLCYTHLFSTSTPQRKVALLSVCLGLLIRPISDPTLWTKRIAGFFEMREIYKLQFLFFAAFEASLHMLFMFV